MFFYIRIHGEVIDCIGICRIQSVLLSNFHFSRLTAVVSKSPPPPNPFPPALETFALYCQRTSSCRQATADTHLLPLMTKINLGHCAASLSTQSQAPRVLLPCSLAASLPSPDHSHSLWNVHLNYARAVLVPHSCEWMSAVATTSTRVTTHSECSVVYAVKCCEIKLIYFKIKWLRELR